MNTDQRGVTIKNLKRKNISLTTSVVFLSGALLLALIKIFVLSEIVVMRTPGMPENSVIARDSFDRGAQLATLNAVTSAIASINPGNAEYQKVFLSYYLAPQAYTNIIAEINAEVEKLKSQRELGSHYWILGGTSGRRYEYDPKINKHFVMGDVHTVNAAKDSAEPYVFEFAFHIENYRLWIDEATSYPGDRPHNSEWLEANKK
jgi:TraE protein